MTAKKRVDLVEVAKSAANPEQTKPESCEIVEKTDDCSLTYYGEEIRTVDQLLKHANIDLAIWEIAEQTVNQWEVAGKKKNGQREGRLWNADTLWKTGLRQIKVKLRRRAPKPIQDGIRDLLRDAKPLATATPKKPRSGDRQMLEIGLFDHHFGKLAWGAETKTNYDLSIAEKEFVCAIDSMLSRASGYNIEQIVLPIGNDFFHVNDWMGQTANGTRVESTDDRFSKVFKCGCRAVQYAIERCVSVAPVEILWIPGNHDRHSSWFLVEWCAAMFNKNRHVRIDNGPGNRKYIQYGVNLLGYVHGDEIKPADLPGLMAQERKQMWADTLFRSWRLGHWHKRKETRYVAGDTFQGVEVRVFPSLCGTDSWHYSHGFIGNARMAECHVFDKKHGPIGSYTINAQEAMSA